MAFQVSPGINVSEFDLTTVVPAVGTTEAAIAGVFNWGPVMERTLVTSESDLVARFGKPTSDNAETFFTAADFLSYSNKLYTVRVVSSDANNAVGTGTAGQHISTVSNTTIGQFIAKWPGAIGNNLEISTCTTNNAYSFAIAGVTMSVGAVTATVTDAANLAPGDILRVGSNAIGFQDLTVTSVVSTTVTFAQKLSLKAALSAAAATRKWGFYKNVSAAPTSGRFHAAVIDEDGGISGVAGSILEVYENVAIASGVKSSQGASVYYKDVIDTQSRWIRSTGTAVTANNVAAYISMAGGTNGATESTVTLGDLAEGYDLFASAEDIDISLILQGKAGHGTADTGLANYIIDNIAESRRDCVVYISPAAVDVVPGQVAVGGEVDAILAFRAALSSSTYAVMDSGYKYRYDKYNDTYRYTPLNGDMAGLAARTDNDRDPWWSPAGYNRGIIKNVVKLAFNPNKAQRDILYPAGVNPVITQPGQGTLLFGDKTLSGVDSAFDRINVRRLFIVLEKAIARAARSTLFEFNDAFTRAQFKNLVEPFLRDVQGRRGIYDFRVVCDDTNNTGEVIDRNEFVGDIYIKPARSINYIQLNFVAVRTGVEFEEIVGQF
jgi:hypothetical protein